MRYTPLRAVTTMLLAVFGYVMAQVAWNELVCGIQMPDAFVIPFFGLPAFFASMAWLARRLTKTVPPGDRAGRPPRTFGQLAWFVFFVPGAALYIARSVLRTPQAGPRGVSGLLWLGWALSCTGMQASMIAELSTTFVTINEPPGGSPALTADGLYAAFAVLNAVVVTALMWIPPHTSLLRGTSGPTPQARGASGLFWWRISQSC